MSLFDVFRPKVSYPEVLDTRVQDFWHFFQKVSYPSVFSSGYVTFGMLDKNYRTLILHGLAERRVRDFCGRKPRHDPASPQGTRLVRSIVTGCSCISPGYETCGVRRLPGAVFSAPGYATFGPSRLPGAGRMNVSGNRSPGSWI